MNEQQREERDGRWVEGARKMLAACALQKIRAEGAVASAVRGATPDVVAGLQELEAALIEISGNATPEDASAALREVEETEDEPSREEIVEMRDHYKRVFDGDVAHIWRWRARWAERLADSTDPVAAEEELIERDHRLVRRLERVGHLYDYCEYRLAMFDAADGPSDGCASEDR